MRLKSFNISKLFGRWNINGQIDSKVTIFTGDNGSFKSHLIHIFHNLLSGERGQDPIEKAILSLSENDDDITVFYRHFNDSLLSLKKAQDDELLNVLASQVRADLKDTNDKLLSERILNADITAYKRNGKNIPIKEYKEACDVDYISTFDIPQKNGNDRDSYLDILLSRLEKDYAYYMSDLAQQMRDGLGKEGKIDINVVMDIYKPNTTFIDIINKSFKNTGKRIDTKRSELHFNVGGDPLTTHDLSSGEKQLLIILLTVLLERGKETILLMDEPEISLHLEWQSDLIDNIFKLNPNCQIIMTSHSPGILLNGWEQYTVQMSEITTKVDK